MIGRGRVLDRLALRVTDRVGVQAEQAEAANGPGHMIETTALNFPYFVFLQCYGTHVHTHSPLLLLPLVFVVVVVTGPPPDQGQEVDRPKGLHLRLDPLQLALQQSEIWGASHRVNI